MRKTGTFLILKLLQLSFTGCINENQLVDISLSKSIMKMTVGKTVILDVHFYPEDSFSENVDWMTSFCAWDVEGISLVSQKNYMCKIIYHPETDTTIGRFVLSDSFITGPHFRHATDTNGELELCDSYTNHQVKYKINVFKKNSMIRLRHSNYTKTVYPILLDATTWIDVKLPSITDARIWNTMGTDHKIPQEKHIIRL